uniref:TMhelix containing protein n=1 Tax=Salmonella phage vB_SEnST11_KE22 TaxID=3161173 RepID=A0AAU8GEA7_9CAUD
MRRKMTWLTPVVILGVVLVAIFIAVDAIDTVEHNCKPNGEQRFVNTVDGVAVENKLICDGGRVKWSRY